MGWGGERVIFYKSVKTSPWQMRFKNLKGKSERKSSKRTISARRGLGSRAWVITVAYCPGIHLCLLILVT